MLIFNAILELLAGMGVFLIAMKMLSTNVESLAGSKIKNMFGKLSKRKLAGVGIGTVASAVIQSSGAVTVMVIGFVNSGVMSLVQATTIIYGANVGTTITAQIVALGLLGTNFISINAIFCALAGIGAFIMLFAKRDSVKKIGGLTAGFGMVFVGLSLMTNSMLNLAQSPQLVNFLASLKNPILLLLAGILITAILQSSSAVTGLTITMLFGGLLTLNQGIYLTFGSNIGTCVVAFIAAIGSITNARRAALIHLLFNVFGVTLFVIIDLCLNFGGTSFAHLLQVMFPNVPVTQLAMMHTIFNVISVIVMLPFTNMLVKLTEKMMPNKQKNDLNEGKAQYDRLSTILKQSKTNAKEGGEQPNFHYVQKLTLANHTPAMAQVKSEVVHMAEIALLNFNRSVNAKVKFDYSAKKEFEKDDELLEFMKRETHKYLSQLSKKQNSSSDEKFIDTAFYALAELEQISNYSKNNFGYANILNNKKPINLENICFSRTKGEI
ncbi:MAG TPA: Na/Pi symporter [Clostridia bacterium]|nr:Na/Pi symporter [Clostridia bacterium]